MELADEDDADDTIEWVKVSGVAWHGDGFFYSRYPAPPAGQEKASINENHQVFFHQARHAAVGGRAGLRGRGQPAALSHACRRPRTSGSRFSTSRSAARARTATRCTSAISSKARPTTFTPLVADDHRRLVRRRRQRRRRAARADQPRARRTGASCRSIRRSPDESELERRAAGAAGAAAGRGHGRRQAVRDVSEGRRRRARTSHSLDGTLENESRAAGPGRGRRLRRLARRHSSCSTRSTR